MDPFTQSILARARERQKIIEEYTQTEKSSAAPLRDTSNENIPKITTASSQPNLSQEKKKINRKEVVSDSVISSKVSSYESALKENNSDGALQKFARQNSKTRVSSDMPGSPQSTPKTLNIVKDNFNMEIKVTSTENVRVEVEFAEQDDGSDSDAGSQISESGLREDTKNRLRRLGKLCAGGEDADISSPIHKTEAKFYAADIDNESIKSKKESDNNARKGGLRGLVNLAETINQWESDPVQDKKPPSKKTTPPKRTWKAPAPPPPSVQNSPSSKHIKHRAPVPPTNNLSDSPLKTCVKKIDVKVDNNPKSSREAEIVAVTPKKVDWDPAVLNNLESQGFTRTSSNSRLVYNYNSQDKNSENEVKTANTTKISKCNINLKNNAISEESEQEEQQELKLPEKKLTPVEETKTSSKVCPRSPSKSAGIANRAAMFESATASPSKTTTKDPALLSVSERKALFEKNKGAALIPKAAFGMSMPLNNTDNPKVPPTSKPTGSSKITSPVRNKYPAPKPPVTQSSRAVETVDSPKRTIAAVPQAGGIASKMAALLEAKSTISQGQIESSVKEQRQKEMDMLLNRFNKPKQTEEEDGIQEADSSEPESEDEEATETTVMITDRQPKILKNTIPVPPPVPGTSGEKRRSGGKRFSKADSPKVAAVLDDIKRIKVSPAKAGKLYPNLSDIETATETENDTDQNRSPTPNNSSIEDSYNESDDANTSFGREILQAVCKNQTPQKRPIYDESTASDVSDVLDDMDDYIDEALAYDDVQSSGPTPPKIVRHSPPSQNQAQPSNSFNYKSYSPTVNKVNTKFQSPMKSTRASPRTSLETCVVDGDNVLPLTHTVSFYRKQQHQESSKTPIRQISRQPLLMEEDEESVSDEYEQVQEKIKELQNEVNKQQMQISQTSQALNLCYSTPEFMGSTEQVEGEKLLLLATHRRQAALHEIQRLKVEKTLRPSAKHAQNVPLEKGTLTISNITLPLKREYIRALAAAGGKGHHVFCLIKCGDQVIVTKLVATTITNPKNPETEVVIPGTYKLNNIYSDFAVNFEVYCLQAQEEFLPHEVKYHINNKKSSNKTTPKKNKDSRLARPIKESPAGPQAVRSSTFALMGYVVLSVQAINKRNWSLNNAPPKSPLEGSVEMRIICELAVSVEHRGFLTMFEDVSGFGAWHRRWCLLKGQSFSYWKYPDDERKVPPIDTIELKNCTTKTVGPVSRDICARLHTLLIERERMAYPSDRDTLVTICKGDKTIIRHLLSADTKEERIEWCNKFNASLTALRMWGNT